MKELLLLANGRIKYTCTKPADATENPYKVVKAYRQTELKFDRNKTYKAII